jgi:hypothetical protein
MQQEQSSQGDGTKEGQQGMMGVRNEPGRDELGAESHQMENDEYLPTCW